METIYDNTSYSYRIISIYFTLNNFLQKKYIIVTLLTQTVHRGLKLVRIENLKKISIIVFYVFFLIWIYTIGH